MYYGGDGVGGGVIKLKMTTYIRGQDHMAAYLKSDTFITIKIVSNLDLIFKRSALVIPDVCHTGRDVETISIDSCACATPPEWGHGFLRLSVMFAEWVG